MKIITNIHAGLRKRVCPKYAQTYVGQRPVSRSDGSWRRLKYRFEGKEKRLSLGVFLNVCPKDARDHRDAALKLLADGIDPSEDPKAQKSARAERAASSVEVVAREWFANTHLTGRDPSDRVVRLLYGTVKLA